jgi:glycosyltransferase involved in cell wall biosynthesis
MNIVNIRKLFDDMNLDCDTVIINQCNQNMKKKIIYKNKELFQLDCNEKGLSRSRNRAIENTSSDISIIADDDMYYYDGLKNKILDSYLKNPDYDILVFAVDGNKTFHKKEKKINFFTSMKISSVQVTFKNKSIKTNNIKFDSDFGSGSTYYMGEENIFLFDCLRCGLRIKYIPIKIGKLLNKRQSTWFKGMNEEYMMARGACFYRMTKKFYWFLILQFAFRKHKKYSKNINLFGAIYKMFLGVKEYKSL